VVPVLETVGEDTETGVVPVVELVAVPMDTGELTVFGSVEVVSVTGVLTVPVLADEAPAACVLMASGGASSRFFIPFIWVWVSPLTCPVTGSILIVVLVWIVM
jgi:hypothetical protein